MNSSRSGSAVGVVAVVVVVGVSSGRGSGSFVSSGSSVGWLGWLVGLGRV